MSLICKHKLQKNIKNTCNIISYFKEIYYMYLPTVQTVILRFISIVTCNLCNMLININKLHFF